MKIKICKNHFPFNYTLKEICPLCKKETEDAHYKFIKIKSISTNKS